VLDDSTALLVPPTPADFAAGILLAIEDPARAAEIGAAARRVAETKYSDEAFLAKTARAIGLLTTGSREASAGDPA
jgi:glycosyltransferase involved in cell wall biosynthesis